MYEIFTPTNSESQILDYRIATTDWRRFAFLAGGALFSVLGLSIIGYQWFIRQPIAIPASTEAIVRVRPQQEAVLNALPIALPPTWSVLLNTPKHPSLILGRFREEGTLFSFAIVPRWSPTPSGFTYRSNNGLISFVSEKEPTERTRSITLRQTQQWLRIAKDGAVGFSLQPHFIADTLTETDAIEGAITPTGLIQTSLPFEAPHTIQGDGTWAYAPTESSWNKTLLQQISFGRLPLNLLPDQPAEIVQWKNGSSTAIELRFAKEPSELTIGLLGTGVNLFKKTIRSLDDGSSAIIETPLSLQELPTSTKTALGFFRRTPLTVRLQSDDTTLDETKKIPCGDLAPTFFFTENNVTFFFGSKDHHLALCRSEKE